MHFGSLVFCLFLHMALLSVRTMVSTGTMASARTMVSVCHSVYRQSPPSTCKFGQLPAKTHRGTVIVLAGTCQLPELVFGYLTMIPQHNTPHFTQHTFVKLTSGYHRGCLYPD
ncbi:uncharacterized protein YALI1_F08590g [Yarrowia lipolytica]|uniref:Secreted protein n=1 Tax=Yarrowia lipolytica TaxID=4952 RepID=A0A1D8NM59_YARLL|nr:hypothetical protein YALI1_F08590g [Yarrowia lipolytica]